MTVNFCNLVLGVVLISLALCADAVIGNVQEKAMKAHRSSNTEVVSIDKAVICVLALSAKTDDAAAALG